MANNWAIIIGINFYQRHPERRLKFAVQDAELMYDFLCNSAKFPPEHIFLCLGDEAHQNSQNYPIFSNILGLLRLCCTKDDERVKIVEYGTKNCTK